MTHSSMPMTLAPSLSRLQSTASPFFDERGRAGYLRLDVAMNHVDIVFMSCSSADPVIVDHDTGHVLLEMPEKLSGSIAHEVFFDQRGLLALKHLVFSADHTEQGVAVRAPREYRQYLSFLIARARDFAVLGSEHTVNAMDLSMRELGVDGYGLGGEKVKRFPEAVLFKDRETGDALVDQASVGRAIFSRARSGQAYGIWVTGLEERLEELMTVTASKGEVRAKDFSRPPGFVRIRAANSYSGTMKQLSTKLSCMLDTQFDVTVAAEEAKEAPAQPDTNGDATLAIPEISAARACKKTDTPTVPAVTMGRLPFVRSRYVHPQITMRSIGRASSKRSSIVFLATTSSCNARPPVREVTRCWQEFFGDNTRKANIQVSALDDASVSKSRAHAGLPFSALASPTDTQTFSAIDLTIFRLMWAFWARGGPWPVSAYPAYIPARLGKGFTRAFANLTLRSSHLVSGKLSHDMSLYHHGDSLQLFGQMSGPE